MDSCFVGSTGELRGCTRDYLAWIKIHYLFQVAFIVISFEHLTINIDNNMMNRNIFSGETAHGEIKKTGYIFLVYFLFFWIKDWISKLKKLELCSQSFA